MVFREEIHVYSENHVNLIKPICGYDPERVNFKVGGVLIATVLG
jgi:hypothetical protein